MGFASPTESAAAGGVGALLIATTRGRFNLKLLQTAAKETSLISGMVFMILIGAQLFAISFRGMYGDDVIMDFVKNSGYGKLEILVMINVLLFGLGFFLGDVTAFDGAFDAFFDVLEFAFFPLGLIAFLAALLSD